MRGLMFARNGEHRLMQLLTKKSTSLGTKSRHYKFTGTSILQHDRQAVKRASTLSPCLKLSLFPSPTGSVTSPHVHRACVLRAFFVTFFCPILGYMARGTGFWPGRVWVLCTFSKCVVITSGLPSRSAYECENNTIYVYCRVSRASLFSILQTERSTLGDTGCPVCAE